MTRRLALQSVAGPRISAAKHPGASHPEAFRSAHRAPFQRPTRAKDFGFRSWEEIVPWSLLPHFSVSRPIAIAITTVAAVAGAALAGLHLLIPLGLAATGVVALWRERGSRHRAAASILRGVLEEIRQTEDVADLRYRIERALELAPDNDGARFLLACILLEEGRHLSALLQLAPLRDHHPDVGEVVLLAAATYVSLAMHDDALRMLGVLDVDRDHPSFRAAASMYQYCCTILGRPIDDGGMEPTGSQASS